MMKCALLALALVTCAGMPVLGAQAADTTRTGGAYSAITVSVGAVRPLGSGALAEFWQARSGIGVEVHTPFHLGELGAVLRTARYEARSASQPAFRSYLLGLDWRFALPGTSAVTPSLSLAAGDFLTVYDGEQPKGLGKESEIYVGGTASVAARLAGATQVRIGVSTVQVLTSTPIRLTQATLGIARTVSTPSWLRSVLQ